jgi:hypothetical protein
VLVGNHICANRRERQAREQHYRDDDSATHSAP